MNLLSVFNLIFFVLMLAYALYLFASVLYTRYLYIKLGQQDPQPLALKARLNDLWVYMFGHKTLLKDKKSGLMHATLFYGFIILQLGAIDLIGKGLTGNPYWLPLGGLYPWFVLTQEITVVLVLFAIGYAGYRRFIEKLPRLKRSWSASLVILFVGALMLTILFSLGMEVLYHQLETSWLHPASSFIALLFSFLSPAAAQVLFYMGWWAHNLVLFAFLIYVPQSKHFHIIMAPINIFMRRQEPIGKLKSLNFEDEEAEAFGVGRIEHFSQKQLIDLYACVECGRCTSVCPASSTGKQLSPMYLITKLRDHLTEKGATITSRSPWVPAYMFQGNTATAAENGTGELRDQATHPSTHRSAAHMTQAEEVHLAGGIISEQELWACTTCRNCEDQCPVANEHVDKIIDLRRYLVMTEGQIPAEAGRVLNQIERQGNPWGFHRSERTQWIDGLDVEVPLLEEIDEPVEILWFVGSMGSYDPRAKKVSVAFAQILKRAGIRFAILGNYENSSGDTARRLGNEYLFQQLCQENIETLQKHQVNKIVTTDPHIFHTLKNEYPDFGLQAEVYHHTQFIEQLIKEGKLVFKQAQGEAGHQTEYDQTEHDRLQHDQMPKQHKQNKKERIVYHDSCYLGRYNQVYESPRQVLKAIPGVELVEMERNRENSMCCGAGGGLMWLEEKEGTRVNVTRTQQAMEVNPTQISSACPYCLTMLTDGTKDLKLSEQIKVRDIAEIVAEALSEAVS
jgi:Fe-S oxidoreductase